MNFFSYITNLNNIIDALIIYFLFILVWISVNAVIDAIFNSWDTVQRPYLRQNWLEQLRSDVRHSNQTIVQQPQPNNTEVGDCKTN